MSGASGGLTVCISGAARGIGLELARIYAARGDRVLACVRAPERADSLRALGEGVEIHALDVVDEASHAALAEALGSRPINIAIANAGVLIGRSGVEGPGYSAENWRETLMTNVFGPFAFARTLLPNLLASAAAGGAPRLAIIASRMGSSLEAAQKGNSYSYRASKGAAINLARNLAGELAPRGIAVGAYHPGWVRTDMGGAQAEVAVEDSAEGLVARFDSLSLETTGAFEDYLGAEMPY